MTDRIRTAARALIIERDALLVVEYRDARGPWFLLPGGGQHHEEPLDDCLRREVREELGVEITVGALLHVREFVSSRLPGSHLGEGFHQVEMLFAAELAGQTRPHMPQTADALQTGFAWLPLDALAAHRLYPERLAGALVKRCAAPCYLGVDP